MQVKLAFLVEMQSTELVGAVCTACWTPGNEEEERTRATYHPSFLVARLRSIFSKKTGGLRIRMHPGIFGGPPWYGGDSKTLEEIGSWFHLSVFWMAYILKTIVHAGSVYKLDICAVQFGSPTVDFRPNRYRDRAIAATAYCLASWQPQSGVLMGMLHLWCCRFRHGCFGSRWLLVPPVFHSKRTPARLTASADEILL